MVRLPAVAGRFYPDEAAELSLLVDRLLEPGRAPRDAIGILAPHAGYIYSGSVAGAVFSQILLPSRSIVLCPNHTGYGPPLSIMRRGGWKTPLGEIQIDDAMCDALMDAEPDLLEDAAAHRYEHAIEVQLPFLQRRGGDIHRFVPIVVGAGGYETLEALGAAIAAAIDRVDRSTLIVASSDMNHYESDAITREKDAMAVEQILSLDPKGLWTTVRREQISMCGFGPATSMLVAARMLGATGATPVKYATSAEVSGDFDRVVGYAGIIVERRPAEQ